MSGDEKQQHWLASPEAQVELAAAVIHRATLDLQCDFEWLDRRRDLHTRMYDGSVGADDSEKIRQFETRYEAWRSTRTWFLDQRGQFYEMCHAFGFDRAAKRQEIAPWLNLFAGSGEIARALENSKKALSRFV